MLYATGHSESELARIGIDHLRAELPAAHNTAWLQIGSPGASFNAKQRVSILKLARSALDCRLCEQRKKALSPFTIDGMHNCNGEVASANLHPALIDAIHRIRTDPGRLTKAWFDDMVSNGVTVEAYVEAVSVVTTVVIIDTLHQSLGLALAPPPATGPGEPTGQLNALASDQGAWLPTLNTFIAESAADANAVADHGLPQIPNIAKAFGLVPCAAELFFGAFRPHYQLQDINLAISQGQAEFVASRVSAINECFY
jgi:hypothetical protein